jgi:hypothetical protein
VKIPGLFGEPWTKFTMGDDLFLKLEKMFRRLPVSGLTVEAKGSGAGRFIYAHTENMAVEASVHPPVFFFEVWKSSIPDSDDAPVFSVDLCSMEELERQVLEWIGGDFPESTNPA